MRTKGLLLAGALCFGLGAGLDCGAQAPEKKTAAKAPARMAPKSLASGECSGARCDIDVLVTVRDGKCKVKSRYDIVKLKTQGIEIYWRVATAGYKFAPADGIEMTQAGHPFGDSHPIGANEWYWKATGTALGYWPYVIRVVDSKNQPCDVDPGLVSDW